jgi:maleylacetoacetate isomerase
MGIILHDYWRSSAAYRVRIALNLKQLAFERRPVNLLEREQESVGNRAVNPQGLVPTLEIDGEAFTQSLAICDVLDARFPDPPLVPADPAARSRVLAMALGIACDLHPLLNLRVLRHLKHELGQDQDRADAWYRHWMAEGLGGVEAMAARNPDLGTFAGGDRPGIADLCIVPQLYNARRFACPLEDYPTLVRIDAAASALPAFAAAHPDRVQPAPLI